MRRGRRRRERGGKSQDEKEKEDEEETKKKKKKNNNNRYILTGEKHLQLFFFLSRDPENNPQFHFGVLDNRVKRTRC